MHLPAALLALAIAAVALLPQGQEPPPKPPAPPPAGAAPLPPIDEPYSAPVPRSDALLRFDRPDPIEGFYRLRRRVVDGVATLAPGDGYLAIGRRHLLLQVQAPTTTADRPLLRAGVWQWRRVGRKLQLSVLLGHLNDTDGGIHLEQPGTVSLRDVQQLGDVLRIYQDDGNFLEFSRAE